MVRVRRGAVGSSQATNSGGSGWDSGADWVVGRFGWLAEFWRRVGS